MATRDENLKKIKAELETMSDDELSMIAGGTKAETAVDSGLLYSYGLMEHKYSELEISFKWKSLSAEVDAGWAKAGITCVTKPSGDNEYFMGGKQILPGEAWKHVIDNFKQIRP